MKWFNIVENDNAINVRIDDNGHALLTVDGIDDIRILVGAINRAFR